MEGDALSSPGPRGRPVRITERDRELVGFVAEHRLVLAAHVQALLDVSVSAARSRLGALGSVGLIRQEAVFHRQPACHQVTRKGLALIGSDLPVPKLDLAAYRHDVGVGWLWVAAQRGTFGELVDITSERSMRSRDAGAGLGGSRSPDASGDRGEEPFGVRLGGFGPRGRPRLHYPDLLLYTQDGRQVALELELTRKGKARREKILAGYGADARVDAVVYLVDDPAVARDVADSARRLGLSALVRVQPVRLGSPGPGRSAAHVQTRAHGARPRIEAGR